MKLTRAQKTSLCVAIVQQGSTQDFLKGTFLCAEFFAEVLVFVNRKSFGLVALTFWRWLSKSELSCIEKFKEVF